MKFFQNKQTQLKKTTAPNLNSNNKTGINLRPWREEKRKKQQQKFIYLSLISAILGLLISLVIWQSTLNSIDTLEQENQFIKQHLLQLSIEMEAVASLQKKHQQLLTHLEAIQQLKNSRLIATQLMQQLAKSINDGIVLTELKRNENQLTLQGQAMQSQAVTTWINYLNLQPSFGEPVLRSMTKNNQTNLTHFTLMIPLKIRQPLQEPVK